MFRGHNAQKLHTTARDSHRRAVMLQGQQWSLPRSTATHLSTLRRSVTSEGHLAQQCHALHTLI